MNSLKSDAKEIIKIVEDIAQGMSIAKEDISTSERFHEIFILAVREYDNRQIEIERLKNEV